MKMQKLHEDVIGNEEQCMHYLGRFGLFKSAPHCPGKNGNPCEGRCACGNGTKVASLPGYVRTTSAKLLV